MKACLPDKKEQAVRATSRQRTQTTVTGSVTCAPEYVCSVHIRLTEAIIKMKEASALKGSEPDFSRMGRSSVLIAHATTKDNKGATSSAEAISSNARRDTAHDITTTESRAISLARTNTDSVLTTVIAHVTTTTRVVTATIRKEVTSLARTNTAKDRTTVTAHVTTTTVKTVSISRARVVTTVADITVVAMASSVKEATNSVAAIVRGRANTTPTQSIA